MPVAHALDVGVLGPVEFIRRDVDPLFDEYVLGDALGVGVSEKFSDLLLDRFYFIFPGALAPGHALFSVLVEDVQRHGCEAVLGI